MNIEEMKMAVLDGEFDDELMVHGIPSHDVLVIAVTDGEDEETGVIQLERKAVVALRDFLTLYLSKNAH